MEIFLLIAALCCAAASVVAALSLARCLRALEAMEAQRAPVPPAAQEEMCIRDRVNSLQCLWSDM